MMANLMIYYIFMYIPQMLLLIKIELFREQQSEVTCGDF